MQSLAYLRSRIAIFFFFTLYLNSSGKWEHPGFVPTYCGPSLWADITANSNEIFQPSSVLCGFFNPFNSFLFSGTKMVNVCPPTLKTSVKCINIF